MLISMPHLISRAFGFVHAIVGLPPFGAASPCDLQLRKRYHIQGVMWSQSRSVACQTHGRGMMPGADFTRGQVLGYAAIAAA
jgi:hypothetical protein